MIRFIFLFLVSPFLVSGQKQIISFGARADSSGAIFIIQQVVRISGDTTHTTASAIKFTSAVDALSTALSIRDGVRVDSIGISHASTENSRHARELDLIIAALRKMQQNTQGIETQEEEIRRLREEIISLKKRN